MNTIQDCIHKGAQWFVAGNAVFGDKDNIERLIINLVSNAVKYTPEGGTIKIKAEGKNGGIRIIVWLKSVWS